MSAYHVQIDFILCGSIKTFIISKEHGVLERSLRRSKCSALSGNTKFVFKTIVLIKTFRS